MLRLDIYATVRSFCFSKGVNQREVLRQTGNSRDNVSKMCRQQGVE